MAHEADIAITSGNSLTVAATLEAAKQAVIKMGATDLTQGKVMIVVPPAPSARFAHGCWPRLSTTSSWYQWSRSD